MTDRRRLQRRARKESSDLVSASEISCYAYCPEQWRLEYGLGLNPTNQAARDAGTRHHTGKAIAERIAGAAIILGRVLLFLAIVGLLVAFLVFR